MPVAAKNKPVSDVERRRRVVKSAASTSDNLAGSGKPMTQAQLKDHVEGLFYAEYPEKDEINPDLARVLLAIGEYSRIKGAYPEFICLSHEVNDRIHATLMATGKKVRQRGSIAGVRIVLPEESEFLPGR